MGKEEAILLEMTLTEVDIERRLRFVDLEAADVERIVQLKPAVLPHIPRLTERFFTYLRRFKEADGLFLNPKVVQEAEALKAEHIAAMVSGTYDQTYVDQRLKLGRIYSNAGLDPKVFLGAFHHMMREIGHLTMAAAQGDEVAAFERFLSLKKVGFFDLGLIVDVIVHDRERTIRQQQQAIHELSTPVLQLRDRLLILPVVGAIDTYRARLLMENLLHAIRLNRAKVVVLDITGVVSVDTTVANHLMQAVQASRLMGATVLVTGLSAEIAQTLVTLGVDLGKFNTIGDLQGGIEEAERLLGLNRLNQ